MCGIVGLLSNSRLMLSNNFIVCMLDELVSRGPDDSGSWSDYSSGIALGHRRLSILDSSIAGHQPMRSHSSRYIISFNGEIYNHLSLRITLEKLAYSKGFVINWKSRSDTETILTAFDFFGVSKALNLCVGMFALALWDTQEKQLFLARDRCGEKPLYFGWQGEGLNKSFLFGSDLKALKAHPSFSANIDRSSITLLLRYGYIPSPFSIYNGISKLEPGSILSISLDKPNPEITKYWDINNVAIARKKNPFNGSPDQAVDVLDALVKNSVRQQMIADVPFGAFLSGGIDSSLIVALMQSQSSQQIKTFTIGFDEESYNEAENAKAVAKHLGTDHAELYVSPNQAMEVIPKLPNLYSEPFADSSQIPTYLISQFAKHKVTVSLSGDAGDELFCGYTRYQLTALLWGRLNLLPVQLRELISQLIISISPRAWDNLSALIPKNKNYVAIGEKMHKGACILASDDIHSLYLALVSQISNPSEWVIGGDEPITKLTEQSLSLTQFNEIEQMMLLDTLGYLTDDILVKVDRAAMGVSLETRVPFLDHRIIEFAWTLPLDYKLKNGQTKWLLRQLLYRYVPKSLIERPKMGFGVPIGEWLRGPLRDWAENLLSENRLRQEGYFYPKIIRSKWAEHLSRRRNWQSQLWTILMFQAWLENEKK